MPHGARILPWKRRTRAGPGQHACSDDGGHQHTCRFLRVTLSIELAVALPSCDRLGKGRLDAGEQVGGHSGDDFVGTDDRDTIVVDLESNPSHLEFVDPVVVGRVRAAQTTREGRHAHRDTNAAPAVLLHGDAAFPGQGVVAETLNLQALDGYTTDPDDGRSTRWSSDPAKGFDVPIIHVNADDPTACISAIRLAFAYRPEFGHDVLVDLVGYRRYGHNEGDEPSYTQPGMYALVKKHLRVSERWASSSSCNAGMQPSAKTVRSTGLKQRRWPSRP